MSNLNRTNINTAAPAVPNPVVHTQATPLAGGMQNLSLKDKVVHEAERVINHAPIVEKQIVNERPVEVRREHHVQPIVHETEHRIQPIIKTQATTEQPFIEKDRNVMQAPIIERAALPAGLEAVERAGPEGILHKAKLEKQVVVEHPVEVRREHHVQPIIHEREHRIQPIIKTQATTERPVIEQDRNVMHAPIVERAALPAGLEAVERAGHEGIVHRAKLEKDVVVEHPVQVKHERHIQPIVHEREHHIQPVVKTEVTAQQTHLRTEKNVMLEPIVERAALPAGLEAVERAGAEGVVHRAKLEKEVIVEHPVQVKHERHIQPIIHEREHHIQPIIKTEVTAEQTIIEKENTVMLPPIIEPTVVVGARPTAVPMAAAPRAAPLMAAPAAPVVATTTLPHRAELAPGMLESERGLGSATTVAPLMTGEREVMHGRDLGHTSTTGSSTTTGTATHVPITQKLKGAMKEVQGTITRNPAKKEEGKMLMHGGHPASTGRTGL